MHAAVFSCLAVGWSRAVGASWPLWLGASASLASLLSAGFVYSRTMTEPRDGPLFKSVSRSSASGLSRLADELARRDFIYGVPLLAFFGKSHWLLAAAAVGSPIFFVVLLWIAARERARTPE